MTIRHRNGSYEVRFVELEDLFRSIPASAFVVTDEHVRGLYGGQLAEGSRVFAAPPGESSKSLSEFERVCRWLAECGAGRDAELVAFGGGVVGDLCGFAASTYMRGVRYVQAPSTLLAQVDSSVGGKVGVDLPEGKNLVGAFYPPAEVLICTKLLESLSRREFANGMAEVWKYAFILDAEFVGRLAGLAIGGEGLDAVVRRCIELKAEVVEEDEFETSGRRAVLNFGHTIGHAVEQASGYGTILHGEAISIGMVAEARLGELLGVSRLGLAADIRELLASSDLPTKIPALPARDLMGAMRHDKKASGGRPAFSLVTEIGACRLFSDVPEDKVMQALEAE